MNFDCNRFTDAVASIRKTSYDFVYELVITRSFADGEEQLLEEDDESMFFLEEKRRMPRLVIFILCCIYLFFQKNFAIDEEEFSFILDEALRFGSMKASQEDSEDSGAYAFTWDDVSGDVDDTYRFITRGRPEVTLEKIQEFEDSVLRCIYERKFQKSSKGIAIEELEKLKSSYVFCFVITIFLQQIDINNFPFVFIPHVLTPPTISILLLCFFDFSAIDDHLVKLDTLLVSETHSLLAPTVKLQTS